MCVTKWGEEGEREGGRETHTQRDSHRERDSVWLGAPQCRSPQHPEEGTTSYGAMAPEGCET